MEVIGVAGRRGCNKVYKVTCTECSKDTELFPDGHFISTKADLKRRRKPCGCSTIKWETWQHLIIIKRAVSGRFKVHSFSEEHHGHKTKVKLECLECGYLWDANSNDVIHKLSGCPKCKYRIHAINRKTPENVAFKNCSAICDAHGYTMMSFPSGYNNQNSKFEYMCPKHGVQLATYDNFVNGGTRCPLCAETGYRPDRPGSIYVVEWTNVNGSFIKFGITNRSVPDRLSDQIRVTKYKPNLIWWAYFEDGNIPKQLEKSIKQSGIELGVVIKKDFPDGYTETTQPFNMSKIEELILHKLTTLEKNQ